MNVQDYIQEDYVPCTYLCPARMLVRMPVCLSACTALYCMHVYIMSKYICNQNSQVQCKIT